MLFLVTETGMSSRCHVTSAICTPSSTRYPRLNKPWVGKQTAISRIVREISNTALWISLFVDGFTTASKYIFQDNEKRLNESMPNTAPMYG